MKKLIILLPIILILTACGKKPAPLVKNFSGIVRAENFNGIEIESEVVANSHDILTARIVRPESLDGYTYYFKNGALKTDYKDLSLETEQGYLPEYSFAGLLYGIMKEINREDGVDYYGKSGSLSEYRGKFKGKSFSVFADYNNGLISKIELKELDFEVKFSKIKIL